MCYVPRPPVPVYATLVDAFTHVESVTHRQLRKDMTTTLADQQAYTGCIG